MKRAGEYVCHESRSFAVMYLHRIVFTELYLFTPG